MELITVVVPVYNMGKYLRRAVDSLLNQTYKNYEVILVDDGSTDDCPNICDEYAKKINRISTIHKENGGLSSARNAGIKIAKGKYIIFPDPDDWVEPSYLEFLYVLQQKYDVDLAISGHYVNDERCSHIHNENGKEDVLTKEEALEVVLGPFGFCGFAWNKLYNVELIQKYDLKFDLELGMAQDLFFAFEYLLKCERVAYSSTPTYHYFQHEGGITNANLSQRKLSGLQTFRKIIEIANEEFPEAVNSAKGTIVNMSLSFIDIYYKSNTNDKDLLRMLYKNIIENKNPFFKSKIYSKSRKILAFIAIISPKMFYLTRKIAKKIVKR